MWDSVSLCFGLDLDLVPTLQSLGLVLVLLLSGLGYDLVLVGFDYSADASDNVMVVIFQTQPQLNNVWALLEWKQAEKFKF